MKSKIAFFLSALSVVTMVGCQQAEPPKQDTKPKSQIARGGECRDKSMNNRENRMDNKEDNMNQRNDDR